MKKQKSFLFLSVAFLSISPILSIISCSKQNNVDSKYSINQVNLFNSNGKTYISIEGENMLNESNGFNQENVKNRIFIFNSENDEKLENWNWNENLAENSQLILSFNEEVDLNGLNLYIDNMLIEINKNTSLPKKTINSVSFTYDGSSNFTAKVNGNNLWLANKSDFNIFKTEGAGNIVGGEIKDFSINENSVKINEIEILIPESSVSAPEESYTISLTDDNTQSASAIMPKPEKIAQITSVVFGRQSERLFLITINGSNLTSLKIDDFFVYKIVDGKEVEITGFLPATDGGNNFWRYRIYKNYIQHPDVADKGTYGIKYLKTGQKYEGFA